jgi:hypothetical protein
LILDGLILQGLILDGLMFKTLGCICKSNKTGRLTDLVYKIR